MAPEAGVPEVPLEQLLPESQRRERPAELPEVSEPELVRHYVTLSSKNFHLDEGFYPLGRDYPEYSDALLVAVTERRTKEHIDQLASLVGAPVREGAPA